MRTGFKMIVAPLALTLLSGCQSFPLTSWMFGGNGRTGGDEVRVANEAADALEDGREALSHGRLPAAIVAFRVALASPATRAYASNGLAVAYARMGHEDLAERYFRAAIATDPSDMRFVANLLRLQHMQMARRDQAEQTRLAQAHAPAKMPAAIPENGPARTAAPNQDSEDARLAGNVERRSRNEVFVSSNGASNSAGIEVVFGSPGAPERAGESEAVRGLAGSEASSPVQAGDASPAIATRALVMDNPFVASLAGNANTAGGQ